MKAISKGSLAGCYWQPEVGPFGSWSTNRSV